MAAAHSKVGVRWIELDEIDSTNAEAMRRAAAGDHGPLYIRADRQLAGRGRSGRAWAAPAGNLAMSRVGRIGSPPAAIAQLSLVAGVAVHKALAVALTGCDRADNLWLKWPNDILFDGAKLAGILVEATTIGGEPVAVIGVGVNVAHAPSVPGRRTAALAAVTGSEPDLRAIARDIASHLEEALVLWDQSRGFEAIRTAWLAASSPVGTAMTIESVKGRVSGFFRGLDHDGALVLADPTGTVHRYSYGDVTLASEWEMS